jgi:hypothetical protein
MHGRRLASHASEALTSSRIEDATDRESREPRKNDPPERIGGENLSSIERSSSQTDQLEEEIPIRDHLLLLACRLTVAERHCAALRKAVAGKRRRATKTARDPTWS